MGGLAGFAHAESTNVVSEALRAPRRSAYFVQLRPFLAPLSVLASGEQSPLMKTIFQWPSGSPLRLELNDTQYAEHLAHELKGTAEWLTFNSSGPQEFKILAPAGELLWMEAYRVHLLLKPKGEAVIFTEPSLASWAACHETRARCQLAELSGVDVELVDTQLIPSANPAQAWTLFYRTHFSTSRTTPRGLREGEGWVRAIDFELDAARAFTDRPSPALVDDLIAQTREHVSEKVPPPLASSDPKPKVQTLSRFHLSLEADYATLISDSSVPDGARDFISASGANLAAVVEAPLLEDFSTNLFLQYGVAGSYSLLGLGQEVVYGVGSTNALFKYGLGGNLLILNGLPSVNFKTLAGGRLTLIYNGPGFFASYRGGLVANSSSGLSFNNFEILATVGWHLGSEPRGWSMIANYSLTHLASPLGTSSQFSVWTLGLGTGL